MTPIGGMAQVAINGRESTSWSVACQDGFVCALIPSPNYGIADTSRPVGAARLPDGSAGSAGRAGVAGVV